jgi:hypothetical protein
MYAGIRANGDRAYLLREDQYRGTAFPIAVFYGFTPTLRAVMADYVKEGLRAVYIDLGYWAREGLHCHHKIVINARHPTAYFQNVKHKPDRARALGVEALPWLDNGKNILLAGMGAKAANVEGKDPESWERHAISALQLYTKRRIIYRPKPSWLGAKPLAGTTYSPKEQSLLSLLANAHAVVTHHSNVAVDALVAGVPAFCWQGVATPLSSQNIADIEEPRRPEGREQWIADIAYTQWNTDEMRRGLPWAHLKEEGLIG